MAQTADVLGGRTVALSPAQRAEAALNVPLEVTPAVKHREGEWRRR